MRTLNVEGRANCGVSITGVANPGERLVIAPPVTTGCE
jgi:hypothetical protein